MIDPTADVRRHVVAAARAKLHGDVAAWNALRIVDDLPVFADQAVTLVAALAAQAADPDRALDLLAGLEGEPDDAA